MEFKEAEKLLLEGKRIRTLTMPKDVFLFLKNKLIFHKTKNRTIEEANPINGNNPMWAESEWEEYKEEIFEGTPLFESTPENGIIHMRGICPCCNALVIIKKKAKVIHNSSDDGKEIIIQHEVRIVD